MLPRLRVLFVLAGLVCLVGCGAPASGTPGAGGAASPAEPVGAAPMLRVDLRLVGLTYVEGGYGVVAVSDGPGGNEVARGAVQLSESAAVVLEVAPGELEVRAWTHGCGASGCAEFSGVELDALVPSSESESDSESESEELCTTSVTVPPAESGRQKPTQTQLLDQYGVLAPDDTRTTCRLEPVQPS